MKQAQRIQTSIINSLEKKALVWLAQRQPSWVTSDMLTALGTLGALIVAVGFVLSNYSIQWLWLSSLGMVVNWYGDSLDGTLARVHNCQRPIYVTINVSINAHLKGEFRLTYIKLGPTEFRLIIIIANTLLIAIPALTALCHSYTIFGHTVTMRILDYVAVVIIVIMALIYLTTTISDARNYAAIDPKKPRQKPTDTH